MSRQEKRRVQDLVFSSSSSIASSALSPITLLTTWSIAAKIPCSSNIFLIDQCRSCDLLSVTDTVFWINIIILYRFYITQCWAICAITIKQSFLFVLTHCHGSKHVWSSIWPPFHPGALPKPSFPPLICAFLWSRTAFDLVVDAGQLHRLRDEV